MKAFSLLVAFLAVSIMSCAEKPKVDTLHKFNHAVPKHSEVCVAATEEDIAALFHRWNASLQTGEAHKVSANYAPKSVLLPTVSSRPRLTAYDKEDYFHHFLENQPVGHIDSQDSREIEIDCNSAIDTGLYTFTFQKTGAAVKARYTFTYKWDGKQWLITSHHSSALPTVDAPPTHIHQVVAQHAEECVEASEEQIAALFDRWNGALQTGMFIRSPPIMPQRPSCCRPSRADPDSPLSTRRTTSTIFSKTIQWEALTRVKSRLIATRRSTRDSTPSNFRKPGRCESPIHLYVQVGWETMADHQPSFISGSTEGVA